VAAGRPIGPIPQIEQVDVPRGMKEKRETFALKITGSSMRNEEILPGDIVIVHKQSTARTGQTVVSIIDGEATIKKYVRTAYRIELHPANDALTALVLTPEQDFRIEGVVTGDSSIPAGTIPGH
jgi:repressor LexA